MTDDFHRTPMGRKYYEIDIPKLITNLGRIADALNPPPRKTFATQLREDIEKKMLLTQKGKNLLKRYLDFMEGFSENTLYDDYKQFNENHKENPFTDEEYDDACDLIRRLTQ